MRGRRPVPNALAMVNNNPGRRPLNTREPKHPPLDHACPDELTDPQARAEWDRLVAALTTTGHITRVDRSTLLAYCHKYGQWLELETAARTQPVLIIRRAVTTTNPAFLSTFNAAHRAFTAMMRAACELGITPSSRSRIVATTPTDDPADAFAAFQRALRPRR